MRPFEDIMRILVWVVCSIGMIVAVLLRNWWLFAVSAWAITIVSITDRNTNVLVTVVTEPDEEEDNGSESRTED